MSHTQHLDKVQDVVDAGSLAGLQHIDLAWLLSDPNDPAAWFDSASGNRRLTIQGVADMPADFVRRFSWGTANE